MAGALHRWCGSSSRRVPDGSETARAIDYSLKHWVALTLYLDDGDLPIDDNWVENRIRPVALGRQDWLLTGSLRAGKRAAAVMSLSHLMPKPVDFDGYVQDVAREQHLPGNGGPQRLLGAPRAGGADGQHAAVSAAQ